MQTDKGQPAVLRVDQLAQVSNCQLARVTRVQFPLRSDPLCVRLRCLDDLGLILAPNLAFFFTDPPVLWYRLRVLFLLKL